MTDNGRYWAKRIIEVLFEPEVRRFNNAINMLIDKNSRFVGYSNSFNYFGENYGRNGQVGRLGSPALVHGLRQEMAVQIELKKQVEQDKGFISQIISRLLDPCEYSQDIRDALPECLVELTTLRSIGRLRDPAYTLNSFRDRHQYKKYLPKIEMYCAVRLLY